MKPCIRCGTQMQDIDKFCMKCGSEYTENDSVKAILLPGSAAPLLTSARNKADILPPVAASQVASFRGPSPRPRRGSSLKMKLIMGAILAIILVAGGFWGWNSYGTEAQVEKKLDLAVKYLSDNNYEQAILAFNDAIKIDPKEVKGYQGLARTYTLQGKYKEARNAYETGIDTVALQNRQILQLGLAGMYIDQNQLTDAEQAYSQIINASPNCLEAYWGLAMVYNQQGDSDKAEAVLRQAIEKNPNEYRGYNTLALFIFQQEKAYWDLARSHTNIGIPAPRGGDNALDNIVRSLALETNQQEAYLVLDIMYENNWAELRSKTGGISNQIIAAMLEFYSYYAAGDYPNAINTYQSKISSQTSNQKARILAAICMVMNSDKTSAETLIKQIKISKLNPWLLGDLGRYYLAAGDHIKAKEYALKALQAQPTILDAIAILQAIDANDPDVKFYCAKALLYNWKPVKRVTEMLISWTKTKNTEVSTPNVVGNTIGNIVNMGLAAIQGEWIFYAVSNDQGIFKIRTDGTNRTRLNHDDAANINVVDDWIYYQNNSEHGRIYKIRTDGSERTELNDDSSSNVIVEGNWIYYTADNLGEKIYKIHTDGSMRTKLNNDATYLLYVIGDWVYYNDLYRMHTDGSGGIKLDCEKGSNGMYVNYASFINVVDDWIYYSDHHDGGKIYKIRTDGSSRTKLNDDYSEWLNVVGDWIYYSNSNDHEALYKIKTDGTNRIKLNDDDSFCLSVVGDWIYYRNDEDAWTIYKIQTDGTQRQLVQ